MSRAGGAPSVLYDAPGPRARRRSLVISLLAGAVLAALVAVAAVRLGRQGQFDAELWSPLFNPGDEFFPDVWRLLGEGATATVIAALLSITLSLLIGTLLGSVRMLLGRFGRLPLVAAIELLRGLPVIVTIFYASRVLPELGVDLSGLPGSDGLWYTVIGLTAYNCVIIAEIIRSGVASLPGGQREAGLAIGLTPAAVLTTIQLPQAFRVMLPALISQMVVILKDSSLAGLLGIYDELLRQGRTISLNLDNPIQTYLLIGVLFIAINYSLSRLAVAVQDRLGRASRTSAQPTTVLVQDATV
jgi:glutamate transport system permease protein